jgi:alpha-galactosidase
MSRRAAPALLGAVLTLSVAAPNCTVAQGSAPNARTPPMGWNSWNHFAENVTDADVRAAADALVTTGMRDAGYIYVNIDDTWEGGRDAEGNIQSNKKFPDMRALADYVHSRGLKIGIYSTPGPKTCAGYEGSYNHEDQDARRYAEWGFDYLKYDQCSFGDTIRQEAGDDLVKAAAMQRAAYEKMHQALLHTGRPIVYSFCQYGLYAVWRWGAESGANLWRTTGMSLWAILAAPLLAGNDLSAMTDDTRSILMNKDVIAIDQDKLGRAGYRVWGEGPLEIWERPLENGHKAIAFFNRGESPMSFPVNAATLGIKSGAEFIDIWQKKTTALKNGSELLVPSHGVALLWSR